MSETTIRRHLTEAGHGAMHTDTHGGDSPIGFITLMSGRTLIVGFGLATGQGHLCPEGTIDALRPGMIAAYAATLRAAGVRVEQHDGHLTIAA